MEQIRIHQNSTPDKVIDAIREINSNGDLATVKDIYVKVPNEPKPSIRRTINELSQEKYQKIVEKISKEKFGNERFGYVVNESIKINYRGM